MQQAHGGCGNVCLRAHPPTTHPRPIIPLHPEWGLDDGDRSYSGGAGSGSGGSSARAYSAAARLPMGTNMQLLLEAPDYRPRWVGRQAGWLVG